MLVTGYVSDPAVALLLAGAAAVLVPSLYEGFGLPVLEAMACGTPVICSRAEALLEVAGDAAETIDGEDVGAWTRAIERAVGDEEWCEQLGLLGLARTGTFTADTMGKEYAKCLNNMITNSQNAKGSPKAGEKDSSMPHDKQF